MKNTSLSQWREHIATQLARGSEIEAFGTLLGLPNGFKVRPDWPRHGALDWCEFGSDGKDSLLRFQEMVRATVAEIGTPDDLGARDGGFNTPTLTAQWNMGKDGKIIPVTVRIISPSNCRLHPDDAEKINPPAPRIHPECAAVLEDFEVELEMMGEI